jgi:hypothetical protein
LTQRENRFILIAGDWLTSQILVGHRSSATEKRGGKMNDELQEAKITAMECDIKEIKQDIKEMPDLIVKKVNESVDMKIKLAIAETEKKYMGKFIALLIGLIGEAVGLIISFIK